MQTYTTYLAIRIAVEANSKQEAEDAAEDIRSSLEGGLPTGARSHGWIDTHRIVAGTAGPEFIA